MTIIRSLVLVVGLGLVLVSANQCADGGTETCAEQGSSMFQKLAGGQPATIQAGTLKEALVGVTANSHKDDKKSVEDGKVADSASQAPVSEALHNEKQRFSDLVAQQEALLRSYRSDLQGTRDSIQHEKGQIAHKTKVWKLWQHVGKWKREIERLHSEVQRLETHQNNLNNLIASTEQHIDSFKGHVTRTADAHVKATGIEEHIANLTAQLAFQQQHYANLTAAHAQIQQDADALGHGKIQNLQEVLADLQRRHAANTRELSDLQQGNHSMQNAWSETTAGITATIAAHNSSIDNLTNLIADKDAQISDVQAQRRQTVQKYDLELAQVRADREALVQHKNTLIAQRDAQVQLLAQVTAEGNANLANLTFMTQQLEQSIPQLEQEIVNRTEEVSRATVAHAEAMRTLREDHAEQIGRLTADIAEETLLKTTAETVLAQLRDEHNLAVSGDTALSGALTNAKTALRTQLTATTHIRDGKTADIQRRRDELARKDKWWNRWWHNLTGAIQRLENEISVLQSERTQKETEMADLEALIASKKSAAEIAKAEEENIPVYESQIAVLEARRTETLANQSVVEAAKEADGNATLEAFQQVLRSAEIEKAGAKGQLARLKTFKNQTHNDLQEEKNLIGHVIDARNASIAGYMAEITINDELKADTEAVKQVKLDDHDEVLTDLQATHSSLVAQKTSVTAVRQHEIEQLNALENDHNENVTNAIRVLNESTNALGAIIDNQSAILSNETLNHHEVMRQLNMTHTSAEDGVTDEINSLKDQKAEANATLHAYVDEQVGQ